MTQSEWKTQFAPDSEKVKMGFSEVKVSDVLTETLVEEASARCDDWLATDEFVNDVWLWFFLMTIRLGGRGEKSPSYDNTATQQLVHSMGERGSGRVNGCV